MMQRPGMNFASLASNTLVAFAAQGVSMLVSIVMSLLVPKVLGVEMYGYWQLFVFYVGYSGVFHLGLNDGVYLLEGGKVRSEIDKKSINSQFVVGTGWQAIVGIVISAFALLWAPNAQRSFVMVAFGAYTIVLNTSAYLGYIFQAMNETKLFSFMSMLERIVFLVPLLILVLLRVDTFEPYVYAYLVARVCALVYSCWYARDILTAGLLAPAEAVREAVASVMVGCGLMLANIASTLILGVARALVDYVWGIEVFGKVSFALSMVNFFLAFVSQASMVLFPALRQGTDVERRSFYRGIRDMMEVAFPGIYLLYFPVVLLLTMWLPQYAESMHYFAILLPLCAFDTKMNVCCTTYLKVLREERTLLRVNVVAVACSAVLSTLGIYLMRSLDAVLLGVVACIVSRSLWCELHLDRRLDVPSTKVPLEELLLTVAFMVMSLTCPGWVATCTYAVLYVSYVFVNRKIARGIVVSMRRVLIK